jgi:hypothetical protein
MLDSQLAHRGLEDLELAERVGFLDRRVVVVSVVVTSSPGDSLLRWLQPALRTLRLQRIAVASRVVRPQIPLLEPDDVEGLGATTVTAPRLILGDHPLGAMLHHRPGAAARVRLRPSVEERCGVSNRDAISDRELAQDSASSRARTSSTFAESSSGVISPLFMSVLAATVTQRA